MLSFISSQEFFDIWMVGWAESSGDKGVTVVTVIVLDWTFIVSVLHVKFLSSLFVLHHSQRNVCLVIIHYMFNELKLASQDEVANLELHSLLILCQRVQHSQCLSTFKSFSHSEYCLTFMAPD